MMKKLLFAALLAVCGVPAQAITYVQYTAAAEGAGYLVDANGQIIDNLGSFITLDYIRAFDSQYAHCTRVGVVCSNLEGNTIADLGSGYEGFRLSFSHATNPPPTTADTYDGGVAYGYYLLPDDMRLRFSAGFTSITVKTFESDDTALTNFKLTVTPIASVPEPASWALMVGGLGLVGSALRRRPRQKLQAVSHAA